MTLALHAASCLTKSFSHPFVPPSISPYCPVVPSWLPGLLTGCLYLCATACKQAVWHSRWRVAGGRHVRRAEYLHAPGADAITCPHGLDQVGIWRGMLTVCMCHAQRLSCARMAPLMRCRLRTTWRIAPTGSSCRVPHMSPMASTPTPTRPSPPPGRTSRLVRNNSSLSLPHLSVSAGPLCKRYAGIGFAGFSLPGVANESTRITKCSSRIRRAPNALALSLDLLLSHQRAGWHSCKHEGDLCIIFEFTLSILKLSTRKTWPEIAFACCLACEVVVNPHSNL